MNSSLNKFILDSFLLLFNSSFVRGLGKVLGGTKGNKVLEYVSGAPVKEFVIERIPNIFDYDELSKYGYAVRSVD
jgi:hypothetical protein